MTRNQLARALYARNASKFPNQEVVKNRLRHLEVAHPSAQSQKNEGIRGGGFESFSLFRKSPLPGVAPPGHALGGCPRRHGWGEASAVQVAEKRRGPVSHCAAALHVYVCPMNPANDNEPLKIGDRVQLRQFPDVQGYIWDIVPREKMIIVQ